MLRVSGTITNTTLNLAAVNEGAVVASGIDHGDLLLSFTDAVMARDDEALAASREQLMASLTPGQVVDTAATIAAFNVVDRIANAIGIPLDATLAMMSAEVRTELGLERFASAANTPG